MAESIPDFVPDGLCDELAPREGFAQVRCGGCGSPLSVPLGPGHWLRATAGAITARHGIGCPCGFTTVRVTLDDIISLPSWWHW